MSATSPPQSKSRTTIEVRDKSPEEQKLALAASEISLLMFIVAVVAVSQAFPFKPVKFALMGLFAAVLLWQTFKRPAVGLALIVFASPGVELAPFKFGAALNTETLIAFFMLFIWFRANQLNGKDPYSSRMSRVLLIYVLVMIAACFNAWLTWHTGLFDLIAAVKNHAIFMVTMPVAFHVLRNRRDQMLVILAASLSLGLNCASGINHSWYAFVTGTLERRRAQALLAIQPNAFGSALAMYFPVFLLLAIYAVGTRITRIWYSSLSLLTGFTLILTLSRGAWMGAIGGLAVAAVYRARRLLVVMLIGAATFQLWVPDVAVDRVNETIDTEGENAGEIEQSTAMRVEQYKSLPAMMAPRPVFGWGYQSFSRVFEKYGTLKRAKGAHSAYCQYGTELGLIGLALLALTLGSVAWAGFRAARYAEDPFHQWLGVGIMGGIIAMAICMGSGARWDPQKMFVFFWVFVAVAERESLVGLANRGGLGSRLAGLKSGT